ncbi:VanZ family protein [Brevibacillus choshinensis]|uniref:VanZ family protein n=1 Tax=Brevibacillus choshinensis TaxID=54911 RepID=A0ABX7FMT1_BRECH|nr:VanZ family protein [Brevibacillus choshinensis]QRG67564.1 VanZ family protein [Brevibacillus choshinensis]
MKKGAAMWTATVTSIAFILYLWLVVKILLFKFGPIEWKALFASMSLSLSHPELIWERLLIRGNLIPFHEIRNYLANMSEGVRIVNFIGNVLAFLPFGFLLPFLHMQKDRSFWKTAILSFLFSLCLEAAQLIASIGIFDVDDLLLNTTGGMLGYIGYKLCRLVLVYRPQKSNVVQERTVH